ncbi:hypothetical protein AAMO2058_001176500 [Amorphochlora amoebiformis]
MFWPRFSGISAEINRNSPRIIHYLIGRYLCAPVRTAMNRQEPPCHQRRRNGAFQRVKRKLSLMQWNTYQERPGVIDGNGSMKTTCSQTFPMSPSPWSLENYGQYVSRSSAADNPPRVESMDLTHPEAPRTVAPPAAGSPAPPPKWTPAGSSSVSSSSPAVPTASLSVTEARRIIEDRNKKNAEDEFAIYKKICVKDI